MRRLRPMRVALQFLTVIPLPGSTAANVREIGRSLLYYPLVGLLLGGLLTISAYVSGLWFDPVLAGPMVVALWVAITGALHLDGLADSVDAWAAGLGSRERTLAVMKDPTSGPMAVVALILVLLIKSQALTSFMDKAIHPLYLVLPPLLARLAVPLLFLCTPYVRPQGLGEALANQFPRRAALSLCVILLLLLVAVSPLLVTKLLLASALLFALLRHLMLRRIGGCTGDTTGALVELVELLALLVLVSHFA